MKTWLSLLVLLTPFDAVAATEVVIFRDGTRMEARRLELAGELALITGLDGKLFSVPRALIESDPSTSTDIIDIIDIRGWARDMVGSVHRAAESYRARSPHDRASVLVADALTEGFSSDRFVDVAARAFAERSRRLAWSEILRRLQSPLVQRMERLERGELAGGAPVAATSARLELVRRLDRASGTSDIALELQAAMTASLLSGVNAVRPSVHQKFDGELERAVDRVRATLAPSTRDRILSSLLATYQGVSDDELREYVEFLESENGLALSQAILESLLVAIQDASQRTAQVVTARAGKLGKTRI